MSIADRFNALIANERMIPKSDFTKYFVYRKGHIILSDVRKETVEAYCVEQEKSYKPKKNASVSSGTIAALRNHGYIVEDVFDEEGYRQAQRDRANRIAKIHEDFKAALFDAFNLEGTDAERFYDRCAARTGDDFDDIEDLFDDFADCIG